MAFKRRLDVSWTLSDGILDAFPIGAQTDALSAVVEAGHAPDPLIGTNLTACEWVYSRRWTYRCAFETPTEGDERVYLIFDNLCGRGAALVNGHMAGRFKGGEFMLPVSGLIHDEGMNTLELRFEPIYRSLPGDNPMPALGVTGGVWMKAVSGLTLEKSMAAVSGHEAAFTHTIDVHTPGTYSFVYTASLDGELVLRKEFPERLAAARTERTHALTIDSPVPFDPQQYDETAYDVRLSVERVGLGCETARFELLFGCENAQKRSVIVRGALNADAARDIRALGARSVCALWQEIEAGPSRFGLTRAREGVPFRVNAPLSPENWAREADGRDLRDNMLMRLRGGAALPEDVEARYGAVAWKDEKRLMRALRWEQASAVMRYALEKRREDRDAQFEWDTAWEALCSGALRERGAHRPAWLALRAAWRDTAVCAELPEGGVSECGIQIRLPIWLMCDREDGGVLTVTARVVSASGEEIASGAYTAAAGRVRRAGTLAVDLPPQAGAYIVRCEAQDAQGRAICRCDETLCVYDEAEPMAALLTLPRATLERAGNAVHNAGAAAAFAEGCALLPGETGDADGEWLNAEIR